MEYDKILELMSEFKKSGLLKIKIEDGDFSIAMEMPGSVIPAVQNSAPATTDISEQTADDASYIKSPIIGTFYAAPGEGIDPFVKAGQTVMKGETVCIVEAMKMMNEIEAPFNCIIETVLVKNEAAVGYNDPLFKIREL